MNSQSSKHLWGSETFQAINMWGGLFAMINIIGILSGRYHISPLLVVTVGFAHLTLTGSYCIFKFLYRNAR